MINSTVDLLPKNSTNRKLVKSVFRQESGHEEAIFDSLAYAMGRSEAIAELIFLAALVLLGGVTLVMVFAFA
jgi:hypothetical protein